ncbi:MAG: 3-hydroxyacyl-CoA dehydrogenase family protein, partial [Planctomycetes bacterium]|nr:3-hydroxyacyl-CoA dehydrogenase family protein [Planctomycetota bacterium]
MSDSPVFHQVTVIGAGTMGSGIAQICAQAGSAVRLYDIEQRLVDSGLARIRKFLDAGVDKGKVAPEQRTAVLGRISGTTDMDQARDGADLVIEAIPEDLELKRRVFAIVAGGVAPSAVLATNTSSLSLVKIFADIPGAGRCIGMHFFNPPPLMPLLEVVRAAATTQQTVDAVLAYARQLGKDPIVVQDSPGFATSRLGVVLGLEAIRMVEAGVAAPADIDKAMELGYRHPMGP